MKIGKSIIVFFSIMIFITVFLTAFLAGLFAIDNVQAEENPESLTAEQKDSYHIISLADEFSFDKGGIRFSKRRKTQAGQKPDI